MVVLAIGLAAIGITLAFAQVRSVRGRLLTETELRAREVARGARQAFDQRVNASLGGAARDRRERPEGAWLRPSNWPTWIDGLYIWDGKTLSTLVPPSRRADEITELVEARLSVRPLEVPPGQSRPRTEVLYCSVNDLAIALACLRATDAAGSPTIVAGRIDDLRLRHELVELLLPSDGSLELVEARRASTRSQRLGPAMRRWAIQPAEAFVWGQSRALLWETAAYVGLTLLALATLIAAIWFLIRTARREMRLAEMKASFVANVSHELKTPLALIRMFGETLQSGRVITEEKRREYYGIITRESDRLTSLIDNILDFARIDAGREEFALVPTDVAEVVRDTYEAYRFQLDNGQFEHHLVIDDDLPRVRADRDAISQVLLNLMSNTVKYSEEERYLAIEVARDTRRGRRGALISVHDHGIGISPEDRRQLFDGFFRASDGRVRRKGGTGLGLALAKHIVDAHGGSLDVESRLVKGTTFRIFLPAVEPAAEGRGTDKPGNAN